MHITCLGMSFRSAPVEVRDRVAFPGELLPQALESLRFLPEVEQAAILSTCNRTEIYLFSSLPADARLRAWLLEYRGISAEDVWPYLYQLTEREATLHLCRVAAGLDSQLLGEVEILGQVKAAVAAAKQAEMLGAELERMFTAAITSGKRARSETRISRGAFSAGRCAVETATRVLGSLGGRSFLILGAGKVAESTARHLRNKGADTVLVANRTHTKAQEMAEQIGGKALRYDQLTQGLVQADIVISSTSAPHFVLLPEHVAEAMRQRGDRDLFLLDLAVPRDIDPEVAHLPRVHLYDIDDLGGDLGDAAACRAAEAQAAEVIAEEEADIFWQWLRARAAAPGLESLRARFEQAQAAHVTRLARKLERLSPEARACIEDLARGLTKRLLHEATMHLKQELVQAQRAPSLPRSYAHQARVRRRSHEPNVSAPARAVAHHVGDRQEV